MDGPDENSANIQRPYSKHFDFLLKQESIIRREQSVMYSIYNNVLSEIKKIQINGLSEEQSYNMIMSAIRTASLHVQFNETVDENEIILVTYGQSELIDIDVEKIKNKKAHVVMLINKEYYDFGNDYVKDIQTLNNGLNYCTFTLKMER
jgi:hypothetical protein